MIKKNKLSLFLLAVVMMLSIYYINMPDDKISIPSSSENVVTKYPDFAIMRLDVLEQRDQEVFKCEQIIASKTETEDAKTKAYVTMQEILERTQKEILVETFINELGYVDCFVESSGNDVYLHILNFVYLYYDHEEVCKIIVDSFHSDISIEIEIVTI